MAQLIDIEELITGLEKSRQRYDRDRNKQGVEGALARCALALEQPLTVWRTTELNSNTNPRDIIESMMLIFVAAITGESVQVIPDPNGQIAVAGSIGVDMRLRLIKAIKDTQSGDIAYERFESKQAGRA